MYIYIYQSKMIKDKSLLGFKMDCNAFLVALEHKNPLTNLCIFTTYMYLYNIFVPGGIFVAWIEQFANRSKCNVL